MRPARSIILPTDTWQIYAAVGLVPTPATRAVTEEQIVTQCVLRLATLDAKKACSRTVPTPAILEIVAGKRAGNDRHYGVG